MKTLISRESIKTLKTWEIKNLLWKLCYNADETLKELALEGEDPAFVKEEIFRVCDEESIRLLFGGNIPYIDTLGVDLGIKDPVIRDTVIEKCYRQVEAGNLFVEKAVKLLKTENDGTEIAERRLIGGLKAIKFSNEEANYLFKTCNLYPISLILSRIVEKKNGKKIESDSDMLEDSNKGKVKNTNIQNIVVPSKVTTLVANKENIQKFFSLLKDEKNSKDFIVALENAKKEVERLEVLQSLLTKLSEEGITFEELLEKKENLVSLFKAMDAL